MGAPPAPRSDLPGGTVTFLFSDIEGSTRLLRRLGEAYAAVQERHRVLLREAFAGHGGIEVDTQGDAFMVAFPRAADAAAAAADAQRALAAGPWPEGVDVRVRMGVHTGEAQVRAEGYVGIDVVCAARICAAAHGGQVVLSQATRTLLGGDGVTDLGEHVLKDLPGAERLYQLEWTGAPVRFPPLKALHATNLPVLTTPLVGRAEELRRIDELLAEPRARLVTLTGAGGSGKSRLALEWATRAVGRAPDGVWLVPLGPVSEPALVLPAVARTLQVREQAGTPLLDALASALAGKRLFLVLDNLEHLLPGAAEAVAALLTRVDGPAILATSRAPLRIAGEQALPVEPLPEGEAMLLFVGRLRAADPTLEAPVEAVREICRRLDGLPLAVELAAARAAVLGVETVRARLHDALGLLTEGRRDAPERQRTLRAAIDWSHALLTPAQQRLHAELSVFAGGCTLDAVEAVCGPGLLDDLGALVDVGLVRRDRLRDAEARFAMLQTVYDYARERLAATGRLDEARDRHAAWALSLARDAEPLLAGPRQAECLARVEAELDNLRAALDHCFGGGDVETGLRILSALGRFWRAHGHAGEARRRLEQGLALAADAGPAVRADAVWTAARQASAQGDWAAAQPLLEEALVLNRRLGREREAVFALSEIGLAALAQGDAGTAATHCEEALALARSLGDARAVSGALNTLAAAVTTLGDHERALTLHEEAAELRRALGDPLLVADSSYNLGLAAFRRGDLDRAARAFADAYALAREVGDAVHIAAAACLLGVTALLAGDVAAAREALREGLALYEELGDDRSRAECLHALGGAAAAEGDREAAERLWQEAAELRAGDPPAPSELAVSERFAGGVVEIRAPAE